MTNQEAIEQLKFDMSMILFNPDTGEEFTLEQVRLRNEDNYKTYLADQLAIAAMEKQEREKWRPINLDDPDSFPDNDRFVLISFSNLEVVDIARWRADTEGGMFCHLDEDYPYSKYGMFVNVWKELPKRWTDESDR